MRALERANRVRLARAELKRAIARGDRDAAEVVRDCPWETESMTIAELLTSQRRWGRTRARKFLLAALAEREQAAGHPDLAPAPPALDRARRRSGAGMPSTTVARLATARLPGRPDLSRAFRRSGS